MVSIIILVLILLIFTYIAIKDWQTGLISIVLNFTILALSIVYAIINARDIKEIGIELLVFVVPFIILEFAYQIFFNKEKDEDKFLIGGGDIVLFAGMSVVLNIFGMMIMFLFSSLSSLIAIKIFDKRRIPFAPFLEFGFLLAILAKYFLQVKLGLG